jgi:hypothetical protein
MRSHDVRSLTAAELDRARRELAASLALARPGSPVRVPIEASLSAIDTELAERGQRASIPCHWPQCRMFRPNGQTYCDEGRNCHG